MSVLDTKKKTLAKSQTILPHDSKFLRHHELLLYQTIFPLKQNAQPLDLWHS